MKRLPGGELLWATDLYEAPICGIWKEGSDAATEAGGGVDTDVRGISVVFMVSSDENCLAKMGTRRIWCAFP